MGKVGLYLAPSHDNWHTYASRLQPDWSRVLMPGATDTRHVMKLRQLVPHTKLSLRWWDIDDGGDGNKRGKISLGESHARDCASEDVAEMVSRVNSMRAAVGDGFPSNDDIWFNALNEPPTWEHHLRPAIVAYNVRFVEECERNGFGSFALELAVGHPEEWPPNWDWAEELFAALDRSERSILALHEYWQEEGPFHVWTDETGKERRDWGALAGRYLACPYMGRMAITECGIDARIYNRRTPPDCGFSGIVAGPVYAAQLEDYWRMVLVDSDILFALTFITDYQDREWSTYDTLKAEHDILGAAHRADEYVKMESAPIPQIIVDPSVDVATEDPDFLRFLAIDRLDTESAPIPAQDMADLWVSSRADYMSWPMCMLFFDAVLHLGLDQARQLYDDTLEPRGFIGKYTARRIAYMDPDRLKDELRMFFYRMSLITEAL